MHNITLQEAADIYYNSDTATLIEDGIADDNVFDTVDLYLQGIYSRDQTLDQLRWKKPNHQI